MVFLGETDGKKPVPKAVIFSGFLVLLTIVFVSFYFGANFAPKEEDSLTGETFRSWARGVPLQCPGSLTPPPCMGECTDVRTTCQNNAQSLWSDCIQTGTDSSQCEMDRYNRLIACQQVFLDCLTSCCGPRREI